MGITEMESKFIVWQVRYYNHYQITLNHVREIVVWQLSYKDIWDLNPEVIGLAIANQVSVTIRNQVVLSYMPNKIRVRTTGGSSLTMF